MVRMALIRTEVFEEYTQHQQRALQTSRHDQHAPRAPALGAQSGGEAARPDETAGCLDAHHGDTEAADAAQSQGGPDLREVLDGGEDGGLDAAEVGPGLKGGGLLQADGECDDQHGGCVQDADGADDQGGAVGGARAGLGVSWRDLREFGEFSGEVKGEEEETACERGCQIMELGVVDGRD